MKTDQSWGFDCAARTTTEVRRPPKTEAVSAPELVVVHSPVAGLVGTRRVLSRREMRVGRDVSNAELRLDDPSISRLHARYVWDGESTRLLDCESRNGTFVNGQRVAQQTVALEHGDVIRMGETLLAFVARDLMQRVHEQVALAARSGLTALLRGETGTGKEVLARRLHTESRRGGSFIALNCASLPRELIFAELFGHSKGAFSGALQRRSGLFLAAQGGTLLLDEIGDCPPDVQVALLRALQERAVRPLGEEREIPVDVQVVAATHVDLEAAIRGGSFRADLYARLAQSVITLPALNQRRHELLALLRTFAAEHGCQLDLSADAAEALLLWDFPFNVREVQAIARLFAAGHAPRAELDLPYLEQQHPDLAQRIVARRAPAAPSSIKTTRPERDKRRDELRSLLQKHDGNVSKVAALLGKPRAQIYRWASASGLSVETIRRDRRAAARLQMSPENL